MTAHLRNSLRGAVSVPSSHPKPRPMERTNNISWNIDLPGEDLRTVRLDGTDPKVCLQACVDEAKCKAWTWVKPTGAMKRGNCWLKLDVPKRKPSSCCLSGIMKAR
jgi:PAN domain-containing protein